MRVREKKGAGQQRLGEFMEYFRMKEEEEGEEEGLRA